MNTCYIDKLVELITSPIITPYNLTEYLKLENYTSLNFFKEEDKIIAKVTFISYNSIENNLYYVFNHSNELLEIYQIEKENKIICFSRENEKNKIIDELNNLQDFNIQKAT